MTEHTTDKESLQEAFRRSWQRSPEDLFADLETRLEKLEKVVLALVGGEETEPTAALELQHQGFIRKATARREADL